MPHRPPSFNSRYGADKPRVFEKARPSSAGRGYNYMWQRFREYFLSMVAVGDEDARYDWQKGRNGLCEECGSGEYLELHHIKPLADGGERFDPYNIKVLCKSCHSRTTLSGDQHARP